MSAKVADSVVHDEKEKASIEQRSSAGSLDARADDSELLAPEVRQAAERRLVRVLDLRLMPTIIVIFLMNYIDVSTTVALCRDGIDQKAAARSNHVGEAARLDTRSEFDKYASCVRRTRPLTTDHMVSTS